MKQLMMFVFGFIFFAAHADDVQECTLYHNNGDDVVALFRLEYVQEVEIVFTPDKGYSVNVIADDGKKRLEVSFSQSSVDMAKETKSGLIEMRDACLNKLKD